MEFISKSIDWLNAGPNGFLVVAVAITALLMLTGFAAAVRTGRPRQTSGEFPTGTESEMPSLETLSGNGEQPVEGRAGGRSRLHRRASVIRKRIRKGNRLQDNLLFLSRFASAPTKVGAIVPSSRSLGRAMAAELPDDYGICVELGGGTGSLTRALLAAGVPRDKLIVLERDPRLVALLRKRFARVRVIEGDAQDLSRLLAEAGVTDVDAVFSGLPFRSLPGPVRRNIAAETFATLRPGGIFVQFTYWGEPPVPPELTGRYGIGGVMTRRVWRNLPPANVWRYERVAAA